MVTNFKCRIFIMFSTPNSICVHDFTLIALSLFVLWCELLYLLAKSANASMYTFFDMEVTYILRF